jgi:hypothetical protein
VKDLADLANVFTDLRKGLAILVALLVTRLE